METFKDFITEALADKSFVGKKFRLRGKNRKDVYTVTDVLITKNLKGKVVKTEIEAEHEFAGQKIKSLHPVATVVRGEIK